MLKTSILHILWHQVLHLIWGRRGILSLLFGRLNVTRWTYVLRPCKLDIFEGQIFFAVFYTIGHGKTLLHPEICKTSLIWYTLVRIQSAHIKIRSRCFTLVARAKSPCGFDPSGRSRDYKSQLYLSALKHTSTLKEYHNFQNFQGVLFLSVNKLKIYIECIKNYTFL